MYDILFLGLDQMNGRTEEILVLVVREIQQLFVNVVALFLSVVYHLSILHCMDYCMSKRKQHIVILQKICRHLSFVSKPLDTHGLYMLCSFIFKDYIFLTLHTPRLSSTAGPAQGGYLIPAMQPHKMVVPVYCSY